MPLLPLNPDRPTPTNPATERLESLKAGMVGNLTAALVYVPIALLNSLLNPLFNPLLDPQLQGNDRAWQHLLRIVQIRIVQIRIVQIDRLPIESWIASGISLAIVLLSGFLFGVTYRYIVRQDKNLQLQSGAVLAFGLVRGLAQVQGQFADLFHTLLDKNLDKKMPLWIGGLEIAETVVESIVLFGAIALMLNWMFDRGWVQRMK